MRQDEAICAILNEMAYGRQFIGIELKESYYEGAIKNLRRARAMQETLFDAQTK
jgi:hypothetical protein